MKIPNEMWYNPEWLSDMINDTDMQDFELYDSTIPREHVKNRISYLKYCGITCYNDR